MELCFSDSEKDLRFGAAPWQSGNEISRKNFVFQIGKKGHGRANRKASEIVEKPRTEPHEPDEKAQNNFRKVGQIQKAGGKFGEVFRRFTDHRRKQ